MGQSILSDCSASTVFISVLNGVPVVAPQGPVRAQGDFVQIGFPLSRIFDADPKGGNAGWTAYLYYGGDEVNARDARRLGARAGRCDLFSGNIQYKWNRGRPLLMSKVINARAPIFAADCYNCFAASRATPCTTFDRSLPQSLHFESEDYIKGESNMALSFANDILPLFRDTPDVQTMKSMGLDLSSYDDVKTKASGIYSRLEDGSMPCDGPWPKEHIGLFKRWMDEGMNP
jgi:hypothetical protein